MPFRKEGMPLQSFSNKAQAPFRGDWIPNSYKGPLPTRLSALPVEGESVLPNSYFTCWNQAPTGLTSIRRKVDMAVSGAQARTSLPSVRFVGPASLLPFGRFLARSCLPLPWATPSSQQIPFPLEAEGCLSFWHLSSPLLSFRLCCSGCPWGSLMGFHICCPQLLVSRVNSCQLQPLGFSHPPWQMPVDI